MIWTWLDTVVQDVGYALRTMRRSPGFTVVAVVSLALGIGANSAIFSFVDEVLLKALPVSHPDQLSLVRARRGAFGNIGVFGYPFFRQLEQQGGVFAAMAAWRPVQLNLSGDDGTSRLDGELVSGGYFATLGVRPVLGRLLDAADDGVEGAHPVCVISYGLWHSRFGGDVRVLQKAVNLDTHPFQIVGITPPEFHGADLHGHAELQVPMSMTKLFMGMERDNPGWSWLQIVGRRRSDLTIEQTQAMLDQRGRQIDARRADGYSLVSGRRGFASVPGRLQDPILVSMGLSALVLLIACANLANLLLAKMSERVREIAVRVALGATRARLVRQLLVESLLLSAGGAGAGLLLAGVLDRALAAMLFDANATASVHARTSGPVLVFTIGISLAAAILFGLAPAFDATRLALTGGLSETPRAGGARRPWLRRALIAAQVAVCLILVFAAALFARSLHNLRTSDLGFRPERIVLASINPEQAGFQMPDARALNAELLRPARLIPGVVSAAAASISPLSGAMFAGMVAVPGHQPSDREPNNNFNIVTPGYFQTLQMPLLRGRDFTDRDDAGAPGVAIVNERFVEYYWRRGDDPVGRRVRALGRDVEIVGLVTTAKYMTVRETPSIVIYLPQAQRPLRGTTVHLRTSGETPAVIAALREQVRQIAPTVPVYNVGSAADQIDARISNERVLGLLSLLFGGLATLVASAGLYGVISYAVVRRTREIGVRMAIGAEGRHIVRLFVGEAIGLSALGLAIGTPAALAGARLFQTLLYGLNASDARTLAGAAAGLLAVACVAALLPALRAAGISPIDALRTQ